MNNQTPAASTKTFYLVLFIVNLFLMLAQLVIFLFFSNNFAVKFTAEKLHIVGMSVLYSAIIGLRKTTDGTVVLEYVYKKENRQI
ncbi:MAG: hypothetical protein QJQ54_00605 [Mollicutes bacterium]|nr:MAG: hypothetical protein QJQ54_00605 [Mollicutes bacterium]